MSILTPHRPVIDPTATPADAPAEAPAPASTPSTAGTADTARPSARSGWLAALRLTTGFIFLWAFFDKLLGLGFATESQGAWINGGSPTEGFLQGVAVGPFESTFHDLAGVAWVDWLFMAGLAGIGIAVMAGIGLRIAAVSGTLLMALMWMAEWPLARHTSAGDPTFSTNPLVESHVIYAVVLIVIAVTHAGDRWGFGRMWARLPFVRRHSAVLR
jgi:thiosulfate dehydrogenase [quinone] large subunit